MASLPAHHISRTSPWPWAPRFDNPWDTWTGDKKLSDVRKFMRQMRELGVPDYGYLSNNRKPSLEDFRWDAGGACTTWKGLLLP